MNARIRHRRAHDLSIAALLLGLAAAPGPAAAAWLNYTEGDGLAHNRVRDIVEDDDETLWFATDGGLTHFDGVTWTTLTTAQGLRSNSLSCAFKDRDGDLWFGSYNGGVARLSGGTLYTYGAASDTLGGNTVYGITQSRQGTLWFATSNGATFYFNGIWGTWRTTNSGLASNVVRSVFEDHDGNLWFGHDGSGASRYSQGIWTRRNSSNGLAGNSVRQMSEDGRKNLWFATEAGASRLDSLGSWTTFRTGDGLAGDDVMSVHADDFGRVWFATRQQGVSRYDGQAWRSYHSFDGLSVFAIRNDRSGNLWISSTAGATRFDGVELETFDDTPTLATRTFLRIMEDRDGTVWLTGPSGGAWNFDGSTWRQLLPGSRVPSVLQDHTGQYWFAAFGQGLMRWDGDTTWVTLTRASHGLATDSTIHVYEDRSHDLWVTGTGGISHSADGGQTWEAFTSASTAGGLGSNAVYYATQDQAGRMWFTTWGAGVSRYDGASGWRRYTTTDGLGANFVWGVFEDRDGYLWAGTYGAGAARFDENSTWQQFNSAHGLINDYPLNFMQDHSGALWFAHDLGGGMTWWNGSEWRSFGLADELPNTSVAFALEDHSGDIWLGTFRGVARYTPDRVPPRTVIAGAPPKVSSSAQQAAVFTVLGESERIEYSYRLDGSAWSEWSSLNAWSNQNLADGVHTLEVRTRDYWVNVDPTPEVVTFEVDATPPLPVIAAPGFGTPVRGIVDIRGDAMDARFANYRVRVRPVGAGSWDPPQATQLAQSTTPVDGATLASWDTSAFPDGSYELRLSVSDSLELTGAAQVTVVVDNAPPYFDETTPVLITTGSGGDVYTSGAELHLYVPPHAFEKDAVVTITPLAGAPPLAGAQPLGAAFELQWESAPLVKPATLEFSLAGANPNASGGVAAVYRSLDGTDWTRLGGTVEAGRVSLPIREPGRYALYADSGGESAGPALGELSFTPRVFSPTGGFAKREVGIGFTLGRAEAVTVRVYNRAGRLVREVVAGQSFGAGANLVRWDGRDREGSVVTDGLYIVTVEAAGKTRRRPLAVVR